MWLLLVSNWVLLFQWLIKILYKIFLIMLCQRFYNIILQICSFSQTLCDVLWYMDFYVIKCVISCVICDIFSFSNFRLINSTTTRNHINKHIRSVFTWNSLGNRKKKFFFSMMWNMALSKRSQHFQNSETWNLSRFIYEVN